jgi:hypothetical protein
MLYGDDIDINAAGAATIDVADVLATRKGISYSAAVALIEAQMGGPFASPEARNQQFNITGHAMLNELDKPAAGNVMMAGVPWIVVIAMASIVLTVKRKKR